MWMSHNPVPPFSRKHSAELTMPPALDLKSAAREIFQQTLAGINIAETLCRKLARQDSHIRCAGKHFDLANFKQIKIIALGKASLAMAEGLIDILAPDFSASGIVVASAPPLRPLSNFQVCVAGHPVPNERSFFAARAILEILRESDRPDTLIFFLLSGGGSSLVELPLDAHIPLGDFQSLHRALVGCGASIYEINSVRKHLSAVKGGRLAAAAPNATKITLAVTDVPEGRESALASGPTLPDPTTASDARQVVEQYSLREKLPASLASKFTAPNALTETPKPHDPAFRNAHFEIILGMHDLFHHAHINSEGLGFLTICDNTTDDWPIPRATDFLLTDLARLAKEHPGQPVAIIADGEVSSPIGGNGIGGRNSAFVLDCVNKIAGQQIAVLSAGTDGIDGVSSAAGAVADGETLSRATAAKLDPQDFARRSDSYNFFNALGDAIITGPTGNNLRDLRILLLAPPGK
jgi:glycerate 2-kinase